MAMEGAVNWTRLKALNASTLSWKLMFSLILMFRINAKFSLNPQVLRKAGYASVRGVLPNVNGAGSAKALMLRYLGGLGPRRSPLPELPLILIGPVKPGA